MSIQFTILYELNTKAVNMTKMAGKSRTLSNKVLNEWSLFFFFLYKRHWGFSVHGRKKKNYKDKTRIVQSQAISIIIYFGIVCMIKEKLKNDWNY